jgi:acrylyl-CoA reductase (NADPH)
MFNAILIQRDENKKQTTELTSLEEAQLPEGDVTVEVEYSTLNYKDALAITGSGPVVRTWPLVPGIDLVGKVTESGSSEWSTGDHVVLNGWGVGESHWGGLAQRARLKGSWLIPLPAGLTAKDSMAVGTAGYTAGLCVEALVKFGVKKDKGPILVTGATGGVGSVAVALLTAEGYEVTAATGKAAEAEYLTHLGATTVIDRAELGEPGKPLQKERWAGVVDAVGSHTLANACAQTRYGGAVAACGLAQGMDLPASVAPFILRGVSLLGIDSVMASRERRKAAWNRVARDLPAAALEAITQQVTLGEAIDKASELLGGKVRGRVVVDVNQS